MKPRTCAVCSSPFAPRSPRQRRCRACIAKGRKEQDQRYGKTPGERTLTLGEIAAARGYDPLTRSYA